MVERVWFTRQSEVVASMALAGEEEEEEGTSPLHTLLELLRNHSSRASGVRR